MEEKSTWQELKQLTKISFFILMFIWKYKNWKERKKLEENNINYQKEFQKPLNMDAQTYTLW